MRHTSSSKKPSHLVYTVKEGKQDGADFWTKIGVAFAHNDGKGFSVMLEAMPFDGKITIRPNEPRSRS